MTHGEHAIVFTTLPCEMDIETFATTLLDEHLAACVNVLPPMDSIYRWKGGVERERERQVLLKTTMARVDSLTARIAQLHPYEVPELLVMPVIGGSDAYLKWVSDATRV